MSGIVKYEGHELAFLPDHGAWTHRFEVGSDTSDRVYRVAYNKATRTWGCSCPGWITHRRCKHLSRLDGADVLKKILELKAG